MALATLLLLAQVELTLLADGVYAALQPDPLRFWDANSVVIVGDDGVVVVDAQGNPVFAKAVLEQIRAITDKPISAVIATHHHTDHVWSYDVYRKAFPGAELIGHRTLRESIPEESEPQLQKEIEGLSAAIDKAKSDGETEGLDAAEDRLDALRAITVHPPSITYDDRMTLHDGRLIELRHFRGHTAGDTVVFLPEEKILITGDLLDDMPSGWQGYPLEWIDALDELEGLDFEILVPGHGSVHQGKEHLRLVRELLETIVAEARGAVDDGKSLEEFQAAIELDTFRERLVDEDALKGRVYDRFIPKTVERTYQYFNAPR